MNSEELRSIQRPIKDKYRSDPDSALVTHKAYGELTGNISTRIKTFEGTVEAGLHPNSGGTGLLACSGDMLLEALVGCAGVTLGSVSTAMGVTIRKGIIRAEGEIDYRGTMAVSKEVPVGFKSIRMIFELDCDAEDEKIESMMKSLGLK